MIVADLRVTAIGEGTSEHHAVERAVEALRARGIRHEVHALGTTVETRDFAELLDVVKDCHDRLRGSTGRLMMQVTLDERFDKPETISSLKEV